MSDFFGNVGINRCNSADATAQLSVHFERNKHSGAFRGQGGRQMLRSCGRFARQHKIFDAIAGKTYEFVLGCNLPIDFLLFPLAILLTEVALFVGISGGKGGNALTDSERTFIRPQLAFNRARIKGSGHNHKRPMSAFSGGLAKFRLHL